MGFAIGKGRRKGGGVRGAAGTMGAGAGSMIIGIGFGREGCKGEYDDDESSAGF
jgi:hypothetical protein